MVETEIVVDAQWENLVQQGRLLVKDFWKWGELGNEVVRSGRYGDNAISKYAKAVKILPTSLYQYMRVTSSISQELRSRYNTLDFFHFYMLVKSEIDNSLWNDLLDKAVADDLSVAEFDRLLRKENPDKDKWISLKFPGYLAPLLSECLNLLAQKLGVGTDTKYDKNPVILEALLVACKERVEMPTPFGYTPIQSELPIDISETEHKI